MAETRETQVIEDVINNNEISNPRTTEEAILAKIVAGETVDINARTRLQYWLCQLESGGSSVTVEPITINENGIKTAPEGKAYSPVNVEVDGYFGSTLKGGTMENPWEDLGFNTIKTLLNNVDLNLNCHPNIIFNASAIGAGRFSGSMYSTETSIGAFGGSVNGNASSAFSIIWNESGLVSAYVEQNGVITDISAYAGVISVAFAFPTRLLS